MVYSTSDFHIIRIIENRVMDMKGAAAQPSGDVNRFHHGPVAATLPLTQNQIGDILEFQIAKGLFVSSHAENMVKQQ